MLKIASWNVNSLRVRMPHVLEWLAYAAPDILALQEIKMPADVYPHDVLEQAGYFSLVSGQRAYNGVAILINKKIQQDKVTEVIKGLPGNEDPQQRVLAASIADVRIVNLYVPNGESIVSEKYIYKIGWLEKLDHFLKQELKTYKNVIVLGDFNIAPDNIDVHDPKRWEGSVLFSLPERQAFQALLQLGFVDCFRQLAPDKQEYSWWDYRMNAFRRKMGLRIDHILASRSMAEKCVQCVIDKTPRAWERPSDHAPVMATFSF